MAELLIKAIDATHKDPEIDKGSYKAGDIVVAMPDGHEWGKEEGLPKFYVVKIPGLDVKEAREKYCSVQYEKTPEGKLIFVNRRACRFEPSLALGKTTLTSNELKTAVVNK